MTDESEHEDAEIAAKKAEWEADEANYQKVRAEYDTIKRLGPWTEQDAAGLRSDAALERSMDAFHAWQAVLPPSMSPPPPPPPDLLERAEQREALIRKPLADDDLPLGITRYQGLKCAAIAEAVALGHTSYLPALDQVSQLLRAAAHEGIGQVSHPDSAETWTRIDAWPWPQPGPPRTQPR